MLDMTYKNIASEVIDNIQDRRLGTSMITSVKWILRFKMKNKTLQNEGVTGKGNCYNWIKVADVSYHSHSSKQGLTS